MIKPEKIAAFLAALENNGNPVTVRMACKSVGGISVEDVLELCQKDAEFKETVSAITRITSLKKEGGEDMVLEKQWADFLNFTKQGLSVQNAAAAAGFAYKTFYNRYNLAKKARADGLPVDDFDIDYERAKVFFKQAALNVISRAGTGQTITKTIKDKNGVPLLDDKGKPLTETVTLPGDWKAMAWALERLFPQEFGRVLQSLQAEGAEAEDSIEEILKAMAAASADNSPIENPNVLAQNLGKLGVDLPDINAGALGDYGKPPGGAD